MQNEQTAYVSKYCICNRCERGFVLKSPTIERPKFCIQCIRIIRVISLWELFETDLNNASAIENIAKQISSETGIRFQEESVRDIIRRHGQQQ
jgi:trimethylamine:corrinoid methyltransferase-like protein